jgi:hypothetical protein
MAGRKPEEYVFRRSFLGARSAHGVGPIAAELSEWQHLIFLCTPNASAPDSWFPSEMALFRERRPILHRP